MGINGLDAKDYNTLSIVEKYTVKFLAIILWGDYPESFSFLFYRS
jgi:hypothetical protein